MTLINSKTFSVSTAMARSVRARNGCCAQHAAIKYVWRYVGGTEQTAREGEVGGQGVTSHSCFFSPWYFALKSLFFRLKARRTGASDRYGQRFKNKRTYARTRAEPFALCVRSFLFPSLVLFVFFERQ